MNSLQCLQRFFAWPTFAETDLELQTPYPQSDLEKKVAALVEKEFASLRSQISTHPIFSAIFNRTTYIEALSKTCLQVLNKILKENELSPEEIKQITNKILHDQATEIKESFLLKKIYSEFSFQTTKEILIDLVLIFAAKENNISAVSALINSEPFKNIDSKRFCGALLIAIKNKKTLIAQALIASEPFKNIDSRDRYVTLITAIKNKETLIAQALIASEPFKNIDSDNLYFALKKAIKNKEPLIAQDLIASEQFKSIDSKNLYFALCDAIKNKEPLIAQDLIASEQFKNIDSKNLYFALCDAIKNKEPLIAQALIASEQFEKINFNDVFLLLKGAIKSKELLVAQDLINSKQFKDISTRDLNQVLSDTCNKEGSKYNSMIMKKIIELHMLEELDATPVAFSIFEMIRNEELNFFDQYIEGQKKNYETTTFVSSIFGPAILGALANKESELAINWIKQHKENGWLNSKTIMLASMTIAIKFNLVNVIEELYPHLEPHLTEREQDEMQLLAIKIGRLKIFQQLGGFNTALHILTSSVPLTLTLLAVPVVVGETMTAASAVFMQIHRAFQEVMAQKA